jgi:hypothetical protein
LRYKKIVDRQSSGKHLSTTMGDGVFSRVRAKELSGKQTALLFSSEFWVEDSHGKFDDL